MLIYKSPLVMQAVVIDSELTTINCCWLYAPSIANSNSNTLEEFEKQKQFLVEKMLAAGISQEEIDSKIVDGAPIDEIAYANESKILGLTQKIRLTDITGDFTDYENLNSEDKRLAFADIHRLLNDLGPLTLEYPALGSESIHRAAITGVILGKNEKNGEEEIFLVSNDTMDKRLKAIALSDYLEVSQSQGIGIDFLTSNDKRLQKPETYSLQEIGVLLESMSQDRYNPNLKTDLISMNMGTIIDPLSNMKIGIQTRPSIQKNSFFNKNPIDKAENSTTDKKDLDDNCTLF